MSVFMDPEDKAVLRRRGLPASELLRRRPAGAAKPCQDSVSVPSNELRDGKPLENSKESVTRQCSVRRSRDGTHRVAAVL